MQPLERVEQEDRAAATCESEEPETAQSVRRLVSDGATTREWAQALADAINRRRAAECMVQVQIDTTRLATDLLVREPDMTGFFRGFVKSVVDDTGSRACAVWLLDEEERRADMWMASVNERFFTRGAADWSDLTIPRETMAAHLVSYTDGWTQIVEYAGNDERLPESVRAFNNAQGIESVLIAPLAVAGRNLGWLALSGVRGPLCADEWKRTLVDAVARQVTLVLHHHQQAEQQRQEERRQAVLEERNRLARDIHDTLAQGFAGILMQLQAAQRAGDLPPAAARNLELAVDLARSSMVEARRSVCALRPQESDGADVAATLERVADLARRGTDVPIDVAIGELPSFSGGADQEIVAIAQEALSNAVRHARARRITVKAEGVRSVGFRLSVADDGRGIARENRELGFGLTSMQERADRIGASLTIITAPRSGTEVVLAWSPPQFAIPEVTLAREAAPA